MRVLNKEQVEKEKLRIVRQLRSCIFLYPTDTVYGIGCNATERKLVHKLRNIKQQYNRPISIIPPSTEWIHENCKVNDLAEEWLERLPGPYTFILKLKNKAVSRSVNLGEKTIGVRIPRHWFSEIVSSMDVPIVTTSANVTGEEFMTSLDNLNKEIEKELDYAIYDGPIEGKPSKVVDLTKKEPVVLRD